MYAYLPHTEADIKAMLNTIGVEHIDNLFDDISPELLLKGLMKIPEGISELELIAHMKKLAAKNMNTNDLLSFAGGGAYDHYIPETVNHLLSRSEFNTAYTPYQPEISQGTLQVIFEYQTMISRLTGLEVSNASHYDGATATAEAIFMACSATKRSKAVVSRTMNPETRKVIKTYLTYKGIELIEIDDYMGITNIEQLNEKVNKDIACVVVQTPNYFGILEDLTEIEKIAHSNKALLITNVNPISLSVMKSPAEWGADIAVGEGQSLGNPLNFGGPYLGFIACTKKLIRKLPGRLVGQTKDLDGKRGFVLTLQAREQHIRRQKATSNITSNQALNALAATIYLSTLGEEGLKEVALNCMANARYLAKGLTKGGKYKLQFNQPFFMEFALQTHDSNGVMSEMIKKNIMPGIDIGNNYSNYNNCLLVCSTEKHNKQQLDLFIKEMEELKC